MTNRWRETMALLANTLVDGEIRDVTIAQAIQLVINEVPSPGLTVRVEQPSLLADPVIERAVFPGLPTRDVLRKLADAAGVEMDVDDEGTVVFRPARPITVLLKQRAVAQGTLDLVGLDRDGMPFFIGDAVTIAHQDDPDYAWMVGLVGIVDVIENNLSQVVVILNHPQASVLSTFQAWVRKGTASHAQSPNP